MNIGILIVADKKDSQNKVYNSLLKHKRNVIIIFIICIILLFGTAPVTNCVTFNNHNTYYSYYFAMKKTYAPCIPYSFML